ncbi:DUF4153 domain-containing protein [Aurantimonas sp. 22II-16-19i]|uniref:DUF4153 domain-containing protein n=1 Tax=Aurantimonas sp. 22II-16-19i TaxID=1317114 RepID=UPI0015941CD1|nr:DUF4153 domain-containing protein [Aurantimonas sp. 22II-16-19i]
MQPMTDEDGSPRAANRAGRIATSLARGAETALLRFPAACLAILAFSLLSNLAVAGYEIPDDRGLVWLLGALYAAAAAAVSATLAAEARGWSRGASQLVAAVAAVVVGVAVHWNGRADNHLPAITAALTLLVPLAPFLGRGGPSRFWNFALWSLVGVTLAFLSVLLFVLGLSAILEMIRFLFEIGLSPDTYEYIYTTALTLVGPLFALGRLPRDFEERPAIGTDRMVSGVRLLVDWVAAPLALATAVILHLYAAKIALTGSLPKNEIGWIVTFDALFVLALRIAADPFLKDGNVFARLFSRAWAFMLVVPLALAAVGIGLRIDAEGVTLQRYYVVLGIFASAIVLAFQLVPRLRRDIRTMAAVPVLLLALSAFGPWGAASVVGASQLGRIVAEFGARVPGDETIAIRIQGQDEKRLQELRSRLAALSDADRLGDLSPYLDPELGERLAVALRSQTAWQALNVVNQGLGIDVASVARAEGRSSALRRNGSIDIAGYDRAAPGWRLSSILVHDGLAPDGISFRIEGSDLVVQVGATTDRFPMAEAIDGLTATLFEAGDTVKTVPVVDLQSRSGRHLRLAIRWLYISRDEDRINAMDFDAFYRAAEWR